MPLNPYSPNPFAARRQKVEEQRRRCQIKRSGRWGSASTQEDDDFRSSDDRYLCYCCYLYLIVFIILYNECKIFVLLFRGGCIMSPNSVSGVICSQFRSRAGGWKGVVAAAAAADISKLQVPVARAAKLPMLLLMMWLLSDDDDCNDAWNNSEAAITVRRRSSTFGRAPLIRRTRASWPLGTRR